VLAQNAFEVERLFDVPPTAFLPVPKVWSSVVRLTPNPKADDEPAFLGLVSSAFAQKRKTLLSNLKGPLPNAAALLQESGIEPSRRAETLTQAEWQMLFKTIKNAGTSNASA
jgi:16S rRNA (adenine1518-N6/adenine1519-N6)-dimethyltransferase